jgi:hypothetical protein
VRLSARRVFTFRVFVRNNASSIARHYEENGQFRANVGTRAVYPSPNSNAFAPEPKREGASRLFGGGRIEGERRERRSVFLPALTTRSPRRCLQKSESAPIFIHTRA